VHCPITGFRVIVKITDFNLEGKVYLPFIISGWLKRPLAIFTEPTLIEVTFRTLSSPSFSRPFFRIIDLLSGSLHK